MIPVIHDVLQSKNFSPLEKNSIKRAGDFFTQFKRFVEPIKDDEMILLICAGGIEKNPEWVEFIKTLPKARIELHCWEHKIHTKMNEKELKNELERARDLINSTFDTQVTTFFPPKNKFDDTVKKVCDEMGLELRTTMFSPGRYIVKRGRKWVDFHYWIENDFQLLRRLRLFPEIKDPIFIVGAPRSGTTALLRWYGRNTPDSITCKEVESIWKKDGDPLEYYASRIRKEGRNIIIDKNARNSVRMKRISRLFPDARWVHIIRDGRAVALSWKKHATRTGRYDQTIEWGAYQWRHFVEYIRKWSKHVRKYEEVRYEDLCDEHEFFVNRNFKWQKELVKNTKIVVTEIQRPLLEELGYIGGGDDS